MEKEKNGTFIQSVINKIFPTIYVEKENGEYSLVDSETIESYQRIIKELQATIEEISSMEVGVSEKVIEEVNRCIDEYLRDIPKGKQDAGRVIATLKSTIVGIQNAIQNDTTQIELGEFEEPKEGSRGGLHSTLSEKKTGKNRGGVIVSKKDEEAKENLPGDYARVDEVLDKLKILDQVMEQIKRILETGNQDISKDDLNEAVSKIIREHSDELTKMVAGTAKQMPQISKVTKVTKTKDFSKLYKGIIGVLAAGLILTNLSKTTDIRVDASQEPNTSTVIEQIDDRIDDSASDNGILNVAHIGVGLEAETIDELGELDDTLKNQFSEEINGWTQVTARHEQDDNTSTLENYSNEIDEITSRYNSIQNPTNKQWIEYQQELYSKYQEILIFNSGVKEKTIEYLSIWNELNNKHIEIGINVTQNEVEHENEIQGNEASIDDITTEIEENDAEIDEVQCRMDFYDILKNLANIENAKNIEDIAETLYEFSKSNIAQEMDSQELIDFISESDLNLLSGYLKTDSQGQTLEEFVSGYKLIENIFNEYVEEYCDGDNTQVDEGLYVDYVKKALKFEDKIGEKGFIDTIKALLQQNDLNRNFYNAYGKDTVSQEKKTGRWERLKETILTFFDGKRMGEYNDLIDGIEEIQNQQQETETNIQNNGEATK